jgi:hypothetical protein
MAKPILIIWTNFNKFSGTPNLDTTEEYFKQKIGDEYHVMVLPAENIPDYYKAELLVDINEMDKFKKVEEHIWSRINKMLEDAKNKSGEGDQGILGTSKDSVY